MKWPFSLCGTSHRWPWVAFALIAGSSLPLCAGDPIIFGQGAGGGVANSAPAGKEAFRSRSLVPAHPQVNQPEGSSQARPSNFDPRRARQAKSQREKQDNWLANMDSEDDIDAGFGIRKYTTENLDKWQNDEHLLSAPETKKGKTGQQVIMPPLDLGTEDGKTTANASPKDPNVGAHKSSELDFRGLLGEAITPPVGGERDSFESNLREVLRSSPSAQERGPSVALDLFGSPRGGAQPAPGYKGRLDPINTVPDLSSRSLNPLVGRPGEVGGKAGGFDLFGSGRSPSSLGGPSFSPGSFGQTPAGVAGFSSLPSPAFRQPDAAPLRSGSSAGSDSPRRQF